MRASPVTARPGHTWHVCEVARVERLVTHFAGVEAVAQDLADAPAQHERDVVQLQLGRPRAQQRDSARRARLRRHSHQAPQRPEARQHLDDYARARAQGSPRDRFTLGRSATSLPGHV